MASQPQPLTALSARPLHQKLIDELKAIAPLMEIEPTGLKKPELLREIQERMREKPQLAENPLLLPLFAHRTSAKSNGKNSADKAEEDDTESLNVAQAASGANKTLLENKVKTDPPAQFARLENAAGGTQATDGELTSENEESDAAVDGDLEPVPTATAPSSPESERKVPFQDGVETVIKSLDVHLSFYHPNDPRIVPRSVVLDDFPVPPSSKIPRSKPSFIAYDDACSLLRHIVSRDPHSPWLSTTKFIVDAWHYIGHRATDILCRLWCNPAPANGSQPDLILVETDANGTTHQTRAFNTETAEQLNSWLSGFEAQLRQMSDVNYDFVIHVLMMMYAERVVNRVQKKKLGLTEEFWDEAIGS
ncbi:hypothetical protein FB45DRAFT_1051101 [Roridomyces roridus]|uniref:Uncharacterized protein n=1 Tax=Roridomyces roridus TaxID=1738132 RepID=A0AAD7CKY4_9AGAR|nr:hypothetical protein FB45DRAFT_1051101 [Roridomyces roridus]